MMHKCPTCHKPIEYFTISQIFDKRLVNELKESHTTPLEYILRSLEIGFMEPAECLWNALLTCNDIKVPRKMMDFQIYQKTFAKHGLDYSDYHSEPEIKKDDAIGKLKELGIEFILRLIFKPKTDESEAE